MSEWANNSIDKLKGRLSIQYILKSYQIKEFKHLIYIKIILKLKNLLTFNDSK